MKTDFTPFVKKAAALLTVFLYACSQLTAQTPVSGLVQGTWTKASSPYLITNPIVIMAGQTLTIEPGVEVRFSFGSSYDMSIRGTLKAEGTPTDSIKFIRFDAGGFPPSNARSGPVTVEAGSVNTSFAYVKMDRLGYQTPNDTLAILNLRSSSCSIRNCSLVNIQGSGIRIDSAGALLAGNSFFTTYQDIVTGFDNLPILAGITGLKIGLLPRMTTDAVIDRGNFYKLLGNLTVPQGRTLNLNPGVDLRLMAARSQLTVLGTLKAEGTATDSVRITSEFAGAANSGTVGPIVLNASSSNNTLKWVKLGGLGYTNSIGQNDTSGVVIVRSPSTVIQNSSFENISGTAINTNNGSTLISGNRFSTLSLDVVTSADYLLSITGNQALKIGITGLSTDATFTRGNLFYRAVRSLTIPAGTTLTIEPGVELQFPFSYIFNSGDPSGLRQITVQGTLKAEGTATDSIRFTGQGTYYYTGPTSGALVINDGSVNSSLKYVSISNITFFQSSDYSAAIGINTSSCTVQNCSFRNIQGAGISYGLSTIALNDSRPQILNNSFSTTNSDVTIPLNLLYKLSGNAPLKVGLRSGAGDARLTRENIYKALEPLIVARGTTMTIDPGTTVRFPAPVGLTVRGTLTAEGTPTDSIRFLGEPPPSGQTGGVILIIDTGSVNNSMKWVRLDRFGNSDISQETRGAIEVFSSFSFQHCSLNSIGSGLRLYTSAAPDLITDNSFKTPRVDAVVSLDQVKVLAGNGPMKIGLINSTVKADDTLYAGHQYYRLLNDIIVDAGRKLTIEPGVKVLFTKSVFSTSFLLVRGTLNANGTVEKNIHFYGTSGPNNVFNRPAGSVVLEPTSQNSSLRWIKIDSLGSNADISSSSPEYPPAALIVKSPSFSIANITIQNSPKIGLALVNAGSPLIVNACFSRNTGGAVLSTGGSPTFTNSNFVTDAYGINNTSTNTADTVHAENCWWGNTTGPNQPITNPSANGDIVSDRVSYRPWSTTAYSCAAGLGSLPLPLTLTSFSVSLLPSHAVQCDWQTSAETNTSHFIVQRSKEGSSFTDIGRVNAAGNSSRPVSYRFTDGAPGSGTTYYRLKMVDKDGAYTYSNVQLVTTGNQSTVAVFPNPARDRLIVQLHNRTAEAVTIRVLDLQGKMLLQERRQMQPGTTTVSLPVASLAKGTYVVQIEGRVTERKIFVKE